MKRFSKYLAGFFLGLNLALSTARAHARDSARVKVTIPFDFVVGNKQLKAGDYVIESLLDREALQFRGKDGSVRQMVFTVPIETYRTGNRERLVFHRESDKYFLSQVWFSADEDGRDLIPGVREKSLGKGQPASDQALSANESH
jgi:hypothetical protein